MDQHPEMQGIWDAFDVQTGLEIVISIHQADGVRRLTLSDWLRPETLQAINDLIVRAAFDLGLEDGKKLRVDTTVSETDIHHPTDNTLLWDVVRVVTRLVGRLDEILPKGISGFTNRTRSARRRMQEIQRMADRERHEHQEEKYRELIRTTEQVVGNARQVLEKTKDVQVDDLLDDSLWTLLHEGSNQPSNHHGREVVVFIPGASRERTVAQTVAA